MKKSISLFMLALFSFAFYHAKAQERTSENSIRISDDDKKAIIGIFKEVDPKLYRLEFNNGKEIYGSRKITMSELEQIRKVRNPTDQSAYLVVAGGTVFIVAIKGREGLLSVLGKEKAAKLSTIMAKYNQAGQ